MAPSDFFAILKFAPFELPFSLDFRDGILYNTPGKALDSKKVWLENIISVKSRDNFVGSTETQKPTIPERATRILQFAQMDPLLFF
jgi:hypothetical protein